MVLFANIPFRLKDNIVCNGLSVGAHTLAGIGKPDCLIINTSTGKLTIIVNKVVRLRGLDTALLRRQ